MAKRVSADSEHPQLGAKIRKFRSSRLFATTRATDKPQAAAPCILALTQPAVCLCRCAVWNRNLRAAVFGLPLTVSQPASLSHCTTDSNCSCDTVRHTRLVWVVSHPCDGAYAHASGAGRLCGVCVCSKLSFRLVPCNLHGVCARVLPQVCNRGSAAAAHNSCHATAFVSLPQTVPACPKL